MAGGVFTAHGKSSTAESSRDCPRSSSGVKGMTVVGYCFAELDFLISGHGCKLGDVDLRLGTAGETEMNFTFFGKIFIL